MVHQSVFNYHFSDFKSAFSKFVTRWEKRTLVRFQCRHFIWCLLQDPFGQIHQNSFNQYIAFCTNWQILLEQFEYYLEHSSVHDATEICIFPYDCRVMLRSGHCCCNLFVSLNVMQTHLAQWPAYISVSVFGHGSFGESSLAFL